MVDNLTYVQCLHCGNIYQVEEEISIEDSIIKSECPRCRHMTGLNCGVDKIDIYLYYDCTIY